MRFVLTIDQAIAAAGIAFSLAIGWHVGGWLTHKLLALIERR